MATAQLATPEIAIPQASDPPENLYRMTVDEYERIGDLLDTHKVELLDGYLVRKMTKHTPHATGCGLAQEALRPITPPGWYLRLSEPVRIPQRDFPAPDLVVARGGPRDYLAGHPGPAEVALVVEVSDSSLSKDRRLVRIYGTAGIAAYWLARPTNDGYAERTVLKAGDVVAVVIDGVEVGHIPVADLLP
jgi:hypothetical protein